MKHQEPTLRFLGATDTVSGSRYLLEAGGKRAVVDCGPRTTHIAHGEPDESDALRVRIKRELGWRRVPEHLEKTSLEDPR